MKIKRVVAHKKGPRPYRMFPSRGTCFQRLAQSVLPISRYGNALIQNNAKLKKMFEFKTLGNGRHV
jgi:hypothetical protein